MNQSIGQVALVVRDYDEAIDFYVNHLGFTVVEDTPIEAQNKRWVVSVPARIEWTSASARPSGW
jgi:catechol 2,3-dioxygenase-like lactoylglutathione lyase family enzyme